MEVREYKDRVTSVYFKTKEEPKKIKIFSELCSPVYLTVSPDLSCVITKFGYEKGKEIKNLKEKSASYILNKLKEENSLLKIGAKRCVLEAKKAINYYKKIKDIVDKKEKIDGRTKFWYEN